MNNAITPPKEPMQGMAIASLVLGILSVVCFGPFAAIPAVILGHIAYSRSRKEPGQYGGGGLAIAGFVLGYVGLVATTAILAGMLLPALTHAKGKAESIKCMNNMKNIGLAFRIYATDHGDQFPFNGATNETGVRMGAAKMDTVQIFRSMSNELLNASVLVCPADRSKRPAQSMAAVTAANISYEVETGPEVKDSNPEQVLARCPIHGHEILCDGSVHRRRLL